MNICDRCGQAFEGGKEAYCSVQCQLADLFLPDVQRVITPLFLKQLAVYYLTRNQTVWEIAQDFNWIDPDVFWAKFEPLRPRFNALLQAYAKKVRHSRRVEAEREDAHAV